jgi:hypothetical protein
MLGDGKNPKVAITQFLRPESNSHGLLLAPPQAA